MYKAKIAATIKAATLMAATISISSLPIRGGDIICNSDQTKRRNGGDRTRYEVYVFHNNWPDGNGSKEIFRNIEEHISKRFSPFPIYQIIIAYEGANQVGV